MEKTGLLGKRDADEEEERKERKEKRERGEVEYKNALDFPLG